eukprot:6576810-Lingulodinium_polyedra.AAC.1
MDLPRAAGGPRHLSFATCAAARACAPVRSSTAAAHCWPGCHQSRSSSWRQTPPADWLDISCHPLPTASCPCRRRTTIQPTIGPGSG